MARYVIATNHGYLDGEYKTKAAAKKVLAALVKESAKECRRGYRSCSVIGSAKSGSVSIKIGGRQGYHLWQRFAINKR